MNELKTTDGTEDSAAEQTVADGDRPENNLTAADGDIEGKQSESCATPVENADVDFVAGEKNATAMTDGEGVPKDVNARSQDVLPDASGVDVKKRKKRGKIFSLKYLFYDVIKFFGWSHFWILLRPKYLYEDGATRHPKGRTLVSTNHGSWSEGLGLIMTFFSRRVHFVMAREIFEKGFSHWFFTHVGCTPIARGNIFDSDGFDKGVEVLNDDRLLAIFPEGSIGDPSAIRRFKAGVGILALKTGAKILPLYMNSRISFTRRAYIVVGKEIDISELCDGAPTIENARIIADKLRAKTEELKKIYDDYKSKKKRKKDR